MYNYEELHKEYLNGKEIRELSIEYGIHVQTLYSGFKRNNLPTILDRKGSKKIDHFFFSKIDTEQKAYFLGLWYADGYTYVSPHGKNMIGIKLHYVDINILEKFRNLVSPDSNITIENNTRILRISSNQLYTDLHNLGCTKKKTREFSPPNIKEEYYRHFIRGYLDGDGTIAKRSSRPNQLQINICSINKDTLDWMKEILINKDVNTVIYKENRKGKILKTPNGYSNICENIYRLCFTTHEGRIKLYNYLYDDANLYFNRKFAIYTEYYNKQITN